MKLIHRIGYYLGGFSIGLILLAFFLSGKKASCDYGFDARTLKDISTKEIIYSAEAQQLLSNNSIDTATIALILRYGDVDFSKVDRKLDSCKIYIIEREIEEKLFSLTVENCNKKATIQHINIK